MLNISLVLEMKNNLFFFKVLNVFFNTTHVNNFIQAFLTPYKVYRVAIISHSLAWCRFAKIL
jgi:hypothetical protein